MCGTCFFMCFSYYVSVQSFWSDMQSWLLSKEIDLSPFTVEVECICCKAELWDIVINIVLLLLGKLFIRICRYIKTIPSLLTSLVYLLLLACTRLQVTGYSFRRRFYPKRLTSSANNRDIGTMYRLGIL